MAVYSEEEKRLYGIQCTSSVLRGWSLYVWFLLLLNVSLYIYICIIMYSIILFVWPLWALFSLWNFVDDWEVPWYLMMMICRSRYMVHSLNAGSSISLPLSLRAFLFFLSFFCEYEIAMHTRNDRRCTVSEWFFLCFYFFVLPRATLPLTAHSIRALILY